MQARVLVRLFLAINRLHQHQAVIESGVSDKQLLSHLDPKGVPG